MNNKPHLSVDTFMLKLSQSSVWTFIRLIKNVGFEAHNSITMHVSASITMTVSSDVGEGRGSLGDCIT